MADLHHGLVVGVVAGNAITHEPGIALAPEASVLVHARRINIAHRGRGPVAFVNICGRGAVGDYAS
jgi:hypothetical protein